jgi:hypothetical protein
MNSHVIRKKPLSRRAFKNSRQCTLSKFSFMGLGTRGMKAAAKRVLAGHQAYI